MQRVPVKRYTPRPYQREAAEAAVRFLTDDTRKGNGLIVAATGSGKSIIIAEIAKRLKSPTLVFCPTKEILQQNYHKMLRYTEDCAMYSASVGKKDIARVTFATIGSVKSHPSLFADFRYILVDEAHLASNTEEGMYKDFFEYLPRKIVGLTATPYRLHTDGVKWNWKEKRVDLSSATSRLVPIVGGGQAYQEVLYNIDTELLLRKGYLAPLRYFDVRSPEMRKMTVLPNTSGAEFSESSLRWMEEHTDFYNYLVSIIRRLQHPKDGVRRNGILCFVRLAEVARFMTTQIESCRMVSAKTPKKERERILRDFAERKFDVLLNVSVLVVGYDRPDLDTVVLGCPTMSLARYYQQVGRALRPSEGKEGWIVDLGGNTERFGPVDRLVFRERDGRWDVYNDSRRLTNVTL